MRERNVYYILHLMTQHEYLFIHYITQYVFITILFFNLIMNYNNYCILYYIIKEDYERAASNCLFIFLKKRTDSLNFLEIFIQIIIKTIDYKKNIIHK